MSAFLDTSVVVASLDPDEPRHAACDRLIAAGGHALYVHTLAEVFSILTGGRLGRRERAAVAIRLLEQSVLPFVSVHALSGKDVMAVLAQCESRGARGGAVYDLLHLAAARKARAEVFVARRAQLPGAGKTGRSAHRGSVAGEHRRQALRRRGRRGVDVAVARPRVGTSSRGRIA